MIDGAAFRLLSKFSSKTKLVFPTPNMIVQNRLFRENIVGKGGENLGEFFFLQTKNFFSEKKTQISGHICS